LSVFSSTVLTITLGYTYGQASNEIFLSHDLSNQIDYDNIYFNDCTVNMRAMQTGWPQ
jgi:hypothetical protein